MRDPAARVQVASSSQHIHTHKPPEASHLLLTGCQHANRDSLTAAHSLQSVSLLSDSVGPAELNSAEAMRQWCVPAATPRAEPLPGRLSVSPPSSGERTLNGYIGRGGRVWFLKTQTECCEFTENSVRCRLITLCERLI